MGCCRLVLALVTAALAVIMTVLVETPVVTELPEPQGVPVAVGASLAASGGAAGAPEVAPHIGGEAARSAAPRMGSGGMFDRIASVYDSTNKWMSLGLDHFWRETLIGECMRLEPDDKVLDLATGTADVGILAGARLRQLGGGAAAAGSVLGLDPSAEMLRRGASKVELRGLEGVVRLAKGDAQNLTSVRGIDATGALAPPTAGVAAGSIDKISMAFGIRNVPDRDRALREMRRALRGGPSNRVCILEFAVPDGKTLLSQAARGFIAHAVPAIGWATTMGSGGEEYEYFQRSILEFPRPLDFARTMARAGLRVRSVTSFAFGAVHLYAAVPAAVTAR